MDNSITDKTTDAQAVDTLAEIMADKREDFVRPPDTAAATAILAAIQADPIAYGIKPKSLEWVSGEYDRCMATALGHEYRINKIRPHGYLWWTPTDVERGIPAKTLEAAQAAAYTDLCDRFKELF